MAIAQEDYPHDQNRVETTPAVPLMRRLGVPAGGCAADWSRSPRDGATNGKLGGSAARLRM